MKEMPGVFLGVMISRSPACAPAARTISPSEQSAPALDPVILPTQSFTAFRQPLAPITDNRQLRSIKSQTSALQAEISFVRASNEKLSIENSILRKPKITKKRKRHLNQEMQSQAEIYDEAAANDEKAVAGRILC